MVFPHLSCLTSFRQDSGVVKKGRWVQNFLVLCWLPLALLSVVFLLSLFLRESIGEVTFAPLLSLMSFFVMAMFRGPGFVLFWILPFALVSFYLIYPFSQFIWTRLVTLILGGLITSYASYLRINAVNLSSSLEKLFSRIAYPVIVSDVTSKIVFFNEAAARCLKIEGRELQKFSWFNLLVDDGGKAKDIERYVRLGISSQMDAQENFRLVGLDGKIWEALVIKEGSQKESRLITTLK